MLTLVSSGLRNGFAFGASVRFIRADNAYPLVRYDCLGVTYCCFTPTCKRGLDNMLLLFSIAMHNQRVLPCT